MNKLTASAILLFLVIVIPSVSQSFTGNLLFKPLTANVFEPRIGSMYQFEDEKVRLDIGASIDAVRFSIDSSSLSAGFDFFTYTRLRSEENFKFPVETSDYFFGANFCWLGSINDFNLEGRLRISHISSHLVDGYSSNSTFWQAPFVYSREFVDLVLAARFSNIRPYIGTTLVFSTAPDNVNQAIFQAGADAWLDLSSFVALRAGYDLKFPSNYDMTITNAFQAGIMLKTSSSAGIFLSTYYYHGNSIHGMFYQDIDSYFAIGFEICQF
jgi:hypothetical protein